MAMADSDNNQHRYQKDNNGFKIETTDPVQDVMNDEELSAAENRIEDLLDQVELD